MAKHDSIQKNISVFWEDALRQYITHAADSFFIINGTGRFIEVNQSCCDLLGYTRKELLAASLGDIDTLRVPIATAQRMMPAMSGSIPRTGERTAGWSMSSPPRPRSATRGRNTFSCRSTTSGAGRRGSGAN